MPPKKYKNTIRIIREELMLTQQELADKLKVSRQTVSAWEHNRQVISDNHLLALTELKNKEKK